MLITRDYIAVGYADDWGELDLALPSHVTMDRQVQCVDASILVSPEEAKDVKFGTPVTVVINIYGGDDE